MRKKAAYISVSAALLLCSNAYGAKNEEVIRYPSLLTFGQVGQSVGASYSFSQHHGTNSSSSASALTERYSFNTVAAILDPHLVTMQILAGVSYSQHFDEQATTSLLDAEYNIAAIAFDMSFHPLTLSTSRGTTLISNGYLPSYTVTNTNNLITAALLNVKVPVQAFYVHSTSETDGLPENSSGTSDSAGLSLHHDYLDISNTGMSLSTNSARSGDHTSAGYTLSLTNMLTLDKAKRYRLSTSVDVTDTKSEEVPQRSVSLQSGLSCAFGKALFGSLTDRLSYDSTLNFDNEKQTQRNNSVSASLSHRLYQSLLSTVALSASNGTSLGGSTSSYGGTARVTYMKRLLGHSNLTVSVDAGRDVSSQNLPVSELSQRNEPHLTVRPGDLIRPLISGTLVPVVGVSSLNRLKDYVEGVDYRVDYALGFIELLHVYDNLGQESDSGDIALSYTVLVNPSVEYRTDSLGTSFGLSLLGGRYNVGGSYSTRDQTLLSGEASNQSLVSSTSASLRADAYFDASQFGIEYASTDSTDEKSSHVGVYGTHSIRTSDNAVISISARDTYSMMESSTSTGTAEYSQNSLMLVANYSRRLFGWMSLSTSLTANDSRSSHSSSDFLGVRGTLSGSYNQLQFSLSGQFLYRLVGSDTTLDNNFSCAVTRFF